jgi:hypothetical protein
MQQPARIAIDLSAESCCVSLLRWTGDEPTIEVIHRFPNGPIHRGPCMHWPLATILAGIETGLRKAAQRRLSVRERARQLCKCLKEREIGPQFMTKVMHFPTHNFYALST